MEQDFDLGQHLSALGVKDAFSRNADFSSIAEDDKLFISKVVHKAFIEVNEEGSEAAAATAVVMTYKMAVFSVPLVFRADHPFIFLLRDNKTKTTLFFGRLCKP